MHRLCLYYSRSSRCRFIRISLLIRIRLRCVGEAFLSLQVQILSFESQTFSADFEVGFFEVDILPLNYGRVEVDWRWAAWLVVAAGEAMAGDEHADYDQGNEPEDSIIY